METKRWLVPLLLELDGGGKILDRLADFPGVFPDAERGLIRGWAELQQDEMKIAVASFNQSIALIRALRSPATIAEWH